MILTGLLDHKYRVILAQNFVADWTRREQQSNAVQGIRLGDADEQSAEAESKPVAPR